MGYFCFRASLKWTWHLVHFCMITHHIEMKQLGALNPRLLANDLESDELCLEGASNCEGIARYLAGHLNER